MHFKTLSELSNDLHSKKISSVELTQYYLDRIAQFDKELNSFITVTPEIALEAAKKADEAFAKDSAKPLTGIPIAQKDIFCTKSVRTSCGSRMLDNFISPYNATVIEKFNQEGTVMLGKTNMDEFAMGSSNENSFYGPVKNPWNTECVPGGSSGGVCSCSCCKLSTCCHGHRHGWLYPTTCSFNRHLWFKAYLWCGFALRNDCVCFKS